MIEGPELYFRNWGRRGLGRLAQSHREETELLVNTLLDSALST
jgi:hypothetical protein